MNEQLRADPAIVELTLSVTPTGRLGTVGDIAPAVFFLASGAAQFIYGAVLPMNGGYPTAFTSVPGTGRAHLDDAS